MSIRTPERNAADAAVRRQARLFELTHDAVIVSNADGVITSWNDGATRVLGWASDAMVGRHVLDRIPTADRAAAGRILSHVRSGRDFAGVYRDTHQNGRPVWLDLRLRRVLDDTGQFVGILGASRDVTARKRAELALAESEKKFRSVAEFFPDQIFVVDPDDPDVPLRILYCNPAAALAHGYEPSELAGRSLRDLIAESDRTDAGERERQILAGDVVTFEETHRHRDGRPIPVEVRARRIEWNGRRAILGIDRDLTERNRIEAALSESRETYERVVESLNAVLWEADPDTFQFTFVSRQAEAIFGYPLETWTSEPSFWPDHIHPDDRDRAVSFCFEQCRLGKSHEFEYRMPAVDGRIVWVRDRVQVVNGPGGSRRIFGILDDVTAKKRLDFALAESEERLQLALASGQLGTFDWDVESGRIVWSRSHYELFGYDPGEAFDVEYRHFADRVHPEDLPALERSVSAAMAAGTEYRHEYRVRWPDGSVRWASGVGRFHYAADRAVAMVGIVHDITDRKESEIALREANDHYRLLADAMQDIVYLMGRDGRGVYVSPSCERLLGYTPDEVVGLEPTPFVHPDEQADFVRSKAENFRGVPTHEEWRYRHKAGHWVWMESLSNPVYDESGDVTGVVCCVRDISRRKSVEDQFRQAQKLEAIGQLAGGVAHDFNNLLTVVNGCGELLLGTFDAGDPRRRLVEDIVRAGERGAGLTRQLLTFSRQQLVKTESLDVNEVVAGTIRMLTRLLGEDIALETKWDPHVGAVRADVGQLEQVVVNLAVNARDAMPHGGRLVIETSEADLTGRADRPPDARPARYVCVTVSDTGHGMPPDVLAHLFEPFFTTKPVGRGTGLGLATVHGIVRQAQGFLDVDSRVGIGTTFRVYLPSFPRDDIANDSVPTATDECRGSETLLVVEDDDAVRALTSAVLERKGYAVLSAASAAEAIHICDERAALPDLVVTDLIMPGMTGRELAEELTRRDPTLKVIYLSGYSPDSAAFDGIHEGRAAFLQKPYTSDSLARVVRQTLDGR